MMRTLDVVMRCRNEMPYTKRALEALATQTGLVARVLFIDCHSSDGSREAADEAGARIVDLDPAQYIPGRVLNRGMRETASEFVAFINADAIALRADSLVRLIAPFERHENVIATYARQLARPDADRLTKVDYARAFPTAKALGVTHGHFFSMAASAVRRSGWEVLPFDEKLKYSEDVDWSLRAASLGWLSTYASDSEFEHSHVYDLKAQYKRHAGEGTADTHIHRLSKASVVSDLLRPLAGNLLRDARAGVVSPSAIATRIAQAAGYFTGRRRGSSA
ncbi:MAG: glycosyltransferase family 2 protein [Sandaracinaceae bacterium]|jgi:rhamnosyltransferase|nr:glycosyltransferase family 2 protein [Sandaracinaceae bacterium]